MIRRNGVSEHYVPTVHHAICGIQCVDLKNKKKLNTHPIVLNRYIRLIFNLLNHIKKE